MKIIVLGSAHPLRGGLASFNERMARAMQDEGHDVEIYTFSLQYPGFLFPGKTQYSDEPAPDGLRIKVCVNAINPFNWIKVGRLIRKARPDIVVCKFWLPFMGPCFGTILRLARRNRHTRVVSVIDNIIPHEKRFGDTLFARYFVKAVDRFIVMSRSVEEEMKQFVTQQPVSYLPHPVYDNYGDPMSRAEACAHIGLDQTQQYLMFFGFIRQYKGLDLLMHAMADPRIKAAGYKLIVAGEYYSNQEEYETLIDSLGIRDQLVLKTDFIADSEVKYYFSAADLVVQPYKSATQSGISQIAYHFEKPMVVTDVGGLPEIVPDGVCGFVVKPEPTAIADAIIQYFSDDALAARLTAGVKEEKKKYQWPHFVHHIYN